MAQLRDIHKLVKVVDRLEKKQGKAPGAQLVSDDYQYCWPNIRLVKRKFKKPHKWSRKRTDQKVKSILDAAKEKQFLKEVYAEHNSVTYRALQVSPRGYDIIQRTFFQILPKGLILEWSKKNSDFNNLVIGFVGGIILSVITVILTILRYSRVQS